MWAYGGIWKEWKWGRLISNCALLLNRDFLHCVPRVGKLPLAKIKRRDCRAVAGGPTVDTKSAFSEACSGGGLYRQAVPLKDWESDSFPGGFQLVCTSEKSFFLLLFTPCKRIFFQPKKLFSNQRFLSLVVGHQRKFGGTGGLCECLEFILNANLQH